MEKLPLSEINSAIEGVAVLLKERGNSGQKQWYHDQDADHMVSEMVEKIKERGIEGVSFFLVIEWDYGSRPKNHYDNRGKNDDWEDNQPRSLAVVQVEEGEEIERKFDGSHCSHFISGYTFYIAPQGMKFESISRDNTNRGSNNPDTSGYDRGIEVFKVIGPDGQKPAPKKSDVMDS